MLIAIDLDDVVLDFVTGVREAVAREYDADLKEEDITDFNLRPVLDPIIGRSWWEWMRDRDWLWSNFGAVKGAIGTIDRMHRDGHYLEILTSKPEWARYNVWKWLGKWRPAVDRVTIVGPTDNKANFSQADVLIDDKLQNCNEWVASRPGRRALLFTRPHNRRIKVGGSIHRVHNWHDVYKEITNG